MGLCRWCWFIYYWACQDPSQFLEKHSHPFFVFSCCLFTCGLAFILTPFCVTCVGWLRPIHLAGKLQSNLLICLWVTWVIFIYDPLVKYIQTSNPTLRE